MSWSIGYDTNWGRDIGYGVPAQCDDPDCGTLIDRGLAYVCGDDVYGGTGTYGCGLHFCEKHLYYSPVDPKTNRITTWGEVSEKYGHGFEDDDIDGVFVCERCADGASPFTPKPDIEEWTQFKMTDPSWKPWRIEKGLEQ